MEEQRLEILSEGLTLRSILQTPGSDSWPLVVLCHGLLSHGEGSKYRRLAQVLAREGIASVRFDFRGCGESEGVLAESTVSKRWKDLQAVIGRIGSLETFDGRLGLLGSSLGGYLALLEMSRNPLVQCSVVWSTPSGLQGLARRLPEVAPVPMSQEFYDDLGRVELLPRLENVQRVMIVHGQNDQQVPLEHALRLFEAAKEPRGLRVLKDGDHRFSQPEARKQAIIYSLEWFRRYL
ncbi:MAG: alpha/beta fold hydrolase [Deltaproteobacteria bacterium]|nr:MAG: alpha/beta fold hydrolase [Deltaproteobacteria bacterium]